MYTRHYFIRGEYFGYCDNAYEMVHAEKSDPYGVAFFCPLCGTLWAMCPVADQPFSTERNYCERHKPGDKVGSWSHGHVWNTEVPGSLWSNWNNHWNLQLPKKVLAREFNLCYDTQLAHHIIPYRDDLEIGCIPD